MKKTTFLFALFSATAFTAFSQKLLFSKTVKNNNWDFKRTRCTTIGIRAVSDTSYAILSVQPLPGNIKSKEAQAKKTTGGKIVDFLSGSNTIDNSQDQPGMPVFFETVITTRGNVSTVKKMLVPSVAINKNETISYEPNNSVFVMSQNENFEGIKNDYRDMPSLFPGYTFYPEQPLAGKWLTLIEEGGGLLGKKNPKPFPVIQSPAFGFTGTGATNYFTASLETSKNENKAQLKGYRSLGLPTLSSPDGKFYGFLYNEDADDNAQYKNFALLTIDSTNKIISKQDVIYPYCVTWDAMSVKDIDKGVQSGIMYFSHRADVKNKYLDPETNKYELFLLTTDGKISFKTSIKAGVDEDEYRLSASFVKDGALYFFIQRDTKKDKSFDLYKVTGTNAEKIYSITRDNLTPDISTTSAKEDFLGVYNGTFRLSGVEKDENGNIYLLGTLYQHVRLFGARNIYSDVHILKLDKDLKLKKYNFVKLEYPYQTDYSTLQNYEILNCKEDNLSAIINYKNEFLSFLKITKEGAIVKKDLLMTVPNAFRNMTPANYRVDKAQNKIYVFNNSTTEADKVEIRVIGY